VRSDERRFGSLLKKKQTTFLCLAFHTQGTKRAMLFEVKVSEPVAKSVNNKIVQFYPVEAVIVRCDDDDIGGGEYDKKKTSTTFTSVRRFSQFRELYAFSSTKGARLPPFPPKVLIVSPQHLEERRAAFEQILNIMMNDRTLNVLPEVASFIGCKELFLDGALRILENAGDDWTIPKGNKNKNGSSNNSNDNINGKSSGNNETTPQRHERRKSNGFDGYDSWEEETPIMSSSRSKQKSLEEFHLSSAALHKTIAASPSPLKFTPASEDKNGSISTGLTSMMKSPATMTATTTSRENPVTLESQQQQQQQQQQPQRAFNGVEAREAIKLGDAASLDAILSSGQVDPNYRDGHGFTLLMLAAMFNKKECCLKLLASGARKELVNRDNETAIDLAPVSLANIIRQYK